MKLRPINVEYHVDTLNKCVIAKLESAAYLSDGYPDLHIITKGAAFAFNEEFNEIIGKRIARARAEKEAFIKYREYILKKIKESQYTLECLNMCLNKVNANIQNQRDYIKSF